MQAIVVKAFIIAVGVVGVVDFVGFSVPMAIRVIQNFVDYYIFSFLFVVCSLAFFPRAFFWIYFSRFGGKFQFCHVSAVVCQCKPHKGNHTFHAAWKMHASAKRARARAPGEAPLK